jgi:predicted nucleotidyltransferase
MAEVPALVFEKIKKFLKLLDDNNINVIKAILFGSYSKGNFDEWSDIDLAIISNDFTGNSFQDRLNLIEYIYESGKDISPIPFREKDFKNNLFAQQEIAKNGILIRNR